MSRRPLIHRLLRARVVVTLADDATFDGVLLESDDRHLVLVDAWQLSTTGDRVKVDGQLWLPAERVAYLQQPGV